MPAWAMRLLAPASVGVVLLFAAGARGATIYFGEDLNAGSSPTVLTRAGAARTAFLAGSGVHGTESFERFATGDGFIAGARPPFDAEFGFTSARIEAGFGHFEVWEHVLAGRYPVSGHHYLLAAGHPQLVSFLDLSFRAPVAGFGFFATDAGDFAERLRVRVRLVDQALLELDVAHTHDSFDANAGAFFFGIRPAAPISSVRIENVPISTGSPFIGFDDFVALRVADPDSGSHQGVISETSTLLLMLAGIAAVGARLRRHTTPC